MWAERFTGLVVEDLVTALRTGAAYIDLNPVRAGLMKDPKDYRFCGYAAALAGAKALRQGFMSFLEPTDWNKAASEYRALLCVAGGSANRNDKAELDPQAIKAELARGRQLCLGQVPRLRIRHTSDGVVLGWKGFVNEMFARHRDCFGPRRKDGAGIIQGVPLPGIRSMRDLKVDAIGCG